MEYVYLDPAGLKLLISRIKEKFGELADRIGANSTAVADIEAKIPAAASAANQLADKKFIADKLAEIIAGAPESLDTLKEISDWISSHADGAAAMNSQIATNKSDIAALTSAYESKVAALGEQIKSLADRASALEAQLNGITFEVV